MNEISRFEVKCSYREGSMYCHNGHIYVFEPGNEMAALAVEDGVVVKCPKCKGLSHIPTPAGEQLVAMVWRHLECRVADLIEKVGLEGE